MFKGKGGSRRNASSNDVAAPGPGDAPQLPHRPQSTLERDHPPDEPPAYTEGVSFAPPQPAAAPRISGYPPIDFGRYLLPSSTLSPDQTTLTVTLPQLCNKPEALASIIRAQAGLPPKPLVCIRGTSQPQGYVPRVDFDLQLNLMPLIWRDEGQAWNYLRMIPDGEVGWRGGSEETAGPAMRGDLTAWAKKFCSDPSAQKSFTLERQVAHLDTSTLEGNIRNLLAQLRYHGRVEISFPVHLARVTIQPPAQGFRAFFAALLSTHHYEVVRAVWPFARTVAGGEAADGAGGGGGGAGGHRECAVMSEAQWWAEWKPAIARALLECRRGWVGAEDRVEAAILAKAEAAPPKDWGLSTW